MYKAIIFDFFGVFCPDLTYGWFTKNVDDYEAKLPALDEICLRSNMGKLGRVDLYKEVAALANISEDRVKLGIEAETTINLSLVDYVRQLKTRGYIIVCLSNGTQEWTTRVMNAQGLADLFDEVILSADLGIIKPDPKIYTYTLEKLKILPKEAIFVDDRKANVDTADRLGMSSILFTDTDSFVKEFERIIAYQS